MALLKILWFRKEAHAQKL